MFTPRSAVPGNLWPAVPDARGARAMAVLHQLEQTQWLTPEALRQLEFRQLERLLDHACGAVPFYRDRLAGAGYAPGRRLTPEIWAAIPYLTRDDIQREGESLRSRQLPAHHGKLSRVTTSGSTGKPITAFGTAVTRFLWQVFTLREHLWHRRDFSGTLAAIRFAKGVKASYPEGARGSNWGAATAMVTDTGPAVLLHINTPIEQQAEWLRRQNPDQFITFPSNLLRLANYCRENRITLPRLSEVRTLAEVLRPEMREACRAAWGVKVTDMYSSQEAGYLALQCPEHEHYHVQSESALVEVLDQAGRPCAPGEVGRVVASVLHNFAMPLVRYDLGDYAEMGDMCGCGRGLPVLTRIMGRVRNLVTLPSGDRKWPNLGVTTINEIVPLRQIQYVQKDLHTIEVRLAVRAEVTADHERKIREIIRDRLGYPFDIAFAYLDEIPRGAGEKYEDFRSEIPD